MHKALSNIKQMIAVNAMGFLVCNPIQYVILAYYKELWVSDAGHQTPVSGHAWQKL